jgi:RHS repeat-associated protein
MIQFTLKALIFLVWIFSSRAVAVDRYSFVGEGVDPIIGISFNRARYYDPETGGFISRDPSGISGGLNIYQYCLSNPINFSDPTGLDPWVRFWGGVRMIGGGVETLVGGSLVIAGAGSSATGAGAVVGVPGVVLGVGVAGHGIDTTQAGARQLWTGQNTDTLTSLGLQKVGLSQTQANLIDTGIGIVGSAGAGTLSAASKVSALSKLPTLHDKISS